MKKNKGMQKTNSKLSVYILCNRKFKPIECVLKKHLKILVVENIVHILLN